MNVEAPLSYIPAYIRGGSVIPRKMRLRRSSKLMFYDPFTLMVALDSNNEAMGYLYMDDETTLDHEQVKDAMNHDHDRSSASYSISM